MLLRQTRPLKRQLFFPALTCLALTAVFPQHGTNARAIASGQTKPNITGIRRLPDPRLPDPRYPAASPTTGLTKAATDYLLSPQSLPAQQPIDTIDLPHRGVWRKQFLPQGLIYRTYLASPLSPRLAAVFNYERGREGWVWDLMAGGQIGLFRYGTNDPIEPQGWQLDIEAAAFPRLTPDDLPPVLEATDYRFGIPLTYGCGNHQFKLAYYHLSSHLGDEFAQLNGGLGQRINYAMDSIVLGCSVYPSKRLRLYGEASYAFIFDFAKPWQFQFGAEYSRRAPAGNCAVPFVATNVHLREEINFSGNFVLQAGWQWIAGDGRRLRVGAQYYNGAHEKYQFFDRTEQKLGIGIWHDF